MHRLFGKQKEVIPPPTLGDAAGGINSRVANIDEKISALDVELRKFKEQLRTAKGPQKNNIQRRAMEVIKRKRMYEQQRDQLAGQAFNIEQTSFAIESIKDTQTSVVAMKAASVQLKLENKKLNINEIEDMQDELTDMLEDMDEISEALGRSYYTPDGIDDCDLEAELAGLEDELEAEELSTPAYLRPSGLPAIPAPKIANTPIPAAGLNGAGAGAGVDEYGLPLQQQYA